MTKSDKRKDEMPDDIWVDVVRHEKDPYWDFNGSKDEFNGGTKYLRAALPSTRRAFRTEDASDEDIAAVEAAKYGKPPVCEARVTPEMTGDDCEEYNKSDSVTVSRDVLQGVRATLKKAIELAHRDLTHISYDKYANGVSFDCIQALASLDAVLSGEGNK